MLSLKCFVFSVFIWLLNLAQPPFNQDSFTSKKQEVTKTSFKNYNHLALLVDGPHRASPYKWSIKSMKLVFGLFNKSSNLRISEIHDAHLLYLKIGYFIPLKFSIRELIFPFHRFT